MDWPQFDAICKMNTILIQQAEQLVEEIARMRGEVT